MSNKMKVLYISVFRDGTGWGQAAIDYMLALDAVGIEVVPRAIKLNTSQPKIPDRILELEKQNSNNPDIVIQNVLPYHMDYNGLIGKNIALYTTETTNFSKTDWPTRINTLDEAWVFNRQSLEASRSSGVDIPIYVVNPATDVSRFNRSYEPLSFKDKLPDSFIFYTIGEFNRRKNLSALLKAFHLEFAPDEPVELFIKTTPTGIKGAQTVEHLCNDIKQNLKIYPNLDSYKKEIIVADYWTEADLMRLHSTCDCFVLPSYGEAWAIPAFDAMGMGKTPIVTDCTGFKDYITAETGWLVPAVREPVFGVTNTFPDLFTGHESWWSANIEDLQKNMREAYENDLIRKQKSLAGIRHAHNFSYEKVGKLMKDILENK